MSDSSHQFTINEFMEHRWIEAKEELIKLDSAFVHAMEVQDTITARGIWLPNEMLSPTKRLPDKWHTVLEAIVDVLQQIDRVQLTILKFEAASNRKEYVYYMDAWMECAWSLAEKVSGLVSLTCVLYRLGKRRDKYRSEIAKVKTNLGQMRTALVHGADDPSQGGLGINARSATKKRLWEGCVIFELQEMIPFFLFSDNEPPGSHGSRARPATKSILIQLGATLSGLDKDIARIR